MQVSTRRFLTPLRREPSTRFQHRLAAPPPAPQIHVFLAMLLLTEQYAAKNQCLQEK
jgi:hypothetical protein